MQKDVIYRQQAIDEINKLEYPSSLVDVKRIIVDLPSAQPEREDYTKMKREFLRMASYIDSLLVCSDEQKETLMNFISRLAEFMPWTERD